MASYVGVPVASTTLIGLEDVMLVMQITQIPDQINLGVHKCESCNKFLEHGSVIGHWDVVEAPVAGAKVEIYFFHESCFYEKLRTIRKFDIDVIEIDFNDVNEIAIDVTENRKEEIRKMIRQSLIV